MRTNRRDIFAPVFSRGLCVVLVSLLAACGPSDGKKKENVSFVVSMEQPAAHTYHVDMTCVGDWGDIVDLKMPMWTPGYYGTFDFPGNVRNFQADDGKGNRLAWEKTTENGWRVCSGLSDEIRVSYDVLATSPFVGHCFLDENRGYIMPAGLFVHIAGRIDHPVTVTIKPFSSWTDIATGLEAAPGVENTYTAADFDILYDSPILIGNLERLPSFTIQGIGHDFVGYRPGEFDRKLFIDNLKKVIEAGINIFGEVPYRHYTFIAIGPGRGGIEHLNSTSFGFNGTGMDSTGRMIRTLGFLAHEYFHHFNVKRIRPLALGPFDYDKPNLTTMLWVSEGFTVYYQNLMLARAGLITRDELLDNLGNSIASYENGTGRFFQSAAQSSFETWGQGPFGGRGQGLVKTISYYTKGAILGFLLDLRIRYETRNAQSLDDVMRTLYQDFYKEKKRGFSDAEFREVCESIAGGPLADVFEYVATTAEIDYPRFLTYAGIELDPPEMLSSPDIGLLVEDKGDDLVVAVVKNDSPSRRAGVEAGDIIHRVDGTSVDAGRWNEILASRTPGDVITLTVSSGGEEREVKIRSVPEMKQSYRMKVIANPTPLQAEILQGLLRRP